MSEKKESLSDKFKQHDSMSCDCYYDEDDIRKAVQELKELLIDGDYYGDRSLTDLMKRIDKIFGEKLI